MSSSLWAKIFGWLQFGTQAVGQIGAANGLPHGAWGWLAFISSLATAVGIHHASNTDGAK